MKAYEKEVQQEFHTPSLLSLFNFAGLKAKIDGMGYGTLVALAFNNLPSLYSSSFCRNYIVTCSIWKGQAPWPVNKMADTLEL